MPNGYTCNGPELPALSDNTILAYRWALFLCMSSMEGQLKGIIYASQNFNVPDTSEAFEGDLRSLTMHEYCAVSQNLILPTQNHHGINCHH